ncbi:MAG: AAA family ATPase [Lachnospiraceae bacterium]|nr:AAA family ATPase [Lachnospiraceae bacterium]
MINKIRVKGLKSIRDLSVNCSNLNIFTGVNSSGKSTFLQALLIASQAAMTDDCLDGLLSLSLGEFREARNFNMPRENIEIEIWDSGYSKPAEVILSEQDDGENYHTRTTNDRGTGEDEPDHDNDGAPLLPVYGINLNYLSCHRIGPMDIYEKKMRGNEDMGIEGEHAFSYLLKNMENPVDSIQNPDTAIGNTLIAQVNHWLDYIAGTTLAIADLKKTNYLQVKYNNNPKNRNQDALYCRPMNVGAGVSYLVSILIVCLGSRRDDIIVIENPEIHLHPKAQSRLCEFLYFISDNHRQIFIETHSDHIFNGVRVGTSSGTMDRNKISVNFFALDENFETQCNPIRFGEFGKIIGTNSEMDINDLFDQFEIDVDKMLGITTGK